MLAQDTLEAGYQGAGAGEFYQPTTGRLTGMTPFSSAAGMMPIMHDENVSATVLVGHFGVEAALLAEAAERENTFLIGSSDALSAQAALFASAHETLIGEELFAASTYLGAGASHSASLTVQDVLRWVIILVLLGGAVLKLFGINLMRIVALVLAILTGLIVLFGYFIPALTPAQTLLLNWAIILAGMAALVGVFNLILVHGTKISQREKGTAYSAILLISLFAAFFFGLVLGPDHPGMRLLVNAVIVPVEASLMALLAVTLLYASIRLLRRRANLMSILFIATALLMLIGSATLPFGEVGALNNFLRPWFQHVLALGGARGILIGVALGTLTTGLRVLIGADRPYGGK